MNDTINLIDRLQTPKGECPVCQCRNGTIHMTNGQDVLRCSDCNKYLYNVPKVESGRKKRTLSTTHEAIKPKQRSRVIDRSGGRCERCGKPAAATTCGLQVGHIVSVKEGYRYGLSDGEINADENLIAECDECNSGHGSSAIPLRIYVAILKARLGEQSGTD